MRVTDTGIVFMLCSGLVSLLCKSTFSRHSARSWGYKNEQDRDPSHKELIRK